MLRKLPLILGVLLTALTLAGCVVEPGGPGYYHHGWWGWHHDHD